MFSKFKKRTIVLFSIFFIAVSVFSNPITTSTPTVFARSDDEKMTEINERIQEAKEELEEHQENLSAVEQERDELQQSKTHLDRSIDEIDQMIFDLRNNSENIDKLIEEKTAEIEEIRAEFENLKNVRNQYYRELKSFIQFSYETDYKSSLDFFLRSETITDGLNSSVYSQDFYEYNNTKLEEFLVISEMYEMVEEILIAKEESLAILTESATISQEDIELLLVEKINEIYDLNLDLEKQNAKILAYEALMKEQELLLARLQREANHILYPEEYDGGIFYWPIESYVRISSDFGPRWGRNHNGVDLAAATGTLILAAYDGVVMSCASDNGWHGGMGNYVIIDHGSGLRTIYMHASAVLVSPGDFVLAGDSIAKVGSTGNSTGPHLHFQVEEGGRPVVPWKYLTDPRKK